MQKNLGLTQRPLEAGMAMNLYRESQKTFLLNNPKYFEDKKDLLLDIKKEISGKFGLKIVDVHVCGSAFFGQSPHKHTPFQPKQSDLDIALVSSDKYVEGLVTVRNLTKNWSDMTSFPIRNGKRTDIEFSDYCLKKGILRVDLMPGCEFKSRFEIFFNEMSNLYLDHFSMISALIYDSESSFSAKQISAIQAVGANVQ